MKRTLRLPEVAERIGVHSSTLRRWCEEGKGPRHIKTPGGTYIFRAEEVEKWLAELEADPVEKRENDSPCRGRCRAEERDSECHEGQE